MSGKELSLITPESAWPAKEFTLAVRKRTKTLNVPFASHVLYEHRARIVRERRLVLDLA